MDNSRSLADETRVADWLLEMEGPRALVNQTDVRIAVAEGDGNLAALNVKWSRRVHGDSPLISLERVFKAGDPAGYRPLTGRDFLTGDERQALDKLPNAPNEFSFKDAKQALSKPDNRTGDFLAKCKHHRLINKLAKNRYMKFEEPRAKTKDAPTDAQEGGVTGVPNETLCSQPDGRSSS